MDLLRPVWESLLVSAVIAAGQCLARVGWREVCEGELSVFACERLHGGASPCDGDQRAGRGGGWCLVWCWFGTDRHASLLLLLSCVGIGGMVCVELNRGLHAFKATTAVV